MSRRDLIDPELRPPLDQLLAVMPGGFNTIPDIVERRGALEQLGLAQELPPNPTVAISEQTVPGPAGAPDITLRIYRPVERPQPASGPLLHPRRRDDPGQRAGRGRPRHGSASSSARSWCRSSTGWPRRTPTRLRSQDCYAGLEWTARNAGELGIDLDRLAIYGASAGGGLTIATALMARDKGYPGGQVPDADLPDDRPPE